MQLLAGMCGNQQRLKIAVALALCSIGTADNDDRLIAAKRKAIGKCRNGRSGLNQRAQERMDRRGRGGRRRWIAELSASGLETESGFCA